LFSYQKIIQPKGGPGGSTEVLQKELSVIPEIHGLTLRLGFWLLGLIVVLRPSFLQLSSIPLDFWYMYVHSKCILESKEFSQLVHWLSPKLSMSLKLEVVEGRERHATP